MKLEEAKNVLPENVFEELSKIIKEKKLKGKVLEKVVEEVVKEYLKAQVEPGEAVGMVAAQSVSEPATQMSVDYKEKVILKRGNRIIIEEIGRFVDRMFNERRYKKEGEYEVLDLNEDLKVLSMDKFGKLHWKKVKALLRHKAPKYLLKIRTRSGREVTATDSHSWVVFDGDIKVVSGKELKVGHRIPVMFRMPEKCMEKIKVGEFISQRYLKRKLPETLDLNWLLGWFFGIYLAEGNATEFYASISNKNEKIRERLREFCKLYGFNYAEYVNSRGGIDFRIYSKGLSNLLKKLFSTGAKNKRIPDFLIGAKEEFVLGLLRGYFDGDGNVGRSSIRFFSKSKELINGIALLLTRIGIFSTIKEEKGGYVLRIPKKYVKIFYEKVGSDLDEKIEKMKRITREGTKIDFIDNFEFPIERIRELLRKHGLLTRYGKRKMGRERLKKLLPHLKFLESDVIWDEIVEIERVKPSKEYVYDVSVGEGFDTFTLASGIVTHNTMRTKHYAGVAAKNVTIGLPRIIEIFNAKTKPSTPMMRIYLKDGRDKKKVEEFAKKIQEITLEDVASDITFDLLNNRLVIKLNEGYMKEFGVTKEKIEEALKKLRGVKYEIKKDTVILSPKKQGIKELYTLRSKIKGVLVSGVPGIKQVYIDEENGEYFIETFGTNLREILKMDEVDKRRVTTNDIFEVWEVLGIEAARNAIIEEASKVLKDQGLPVDIRHLMLIADLMTVDGRIKGITRYGIPGEKSSILARVGFETPVQHLVLSSVKGEVEDMSGVLENVMVNQIVPLGTGLPKLLFGVPYEEGGD